jgi:putative heme transporter
VKAEERKVEVPHLLASSAAYSWRFLVVVAAVTLIVYILVTLRLIVLPVFIALLLCTLLVPVAERLRRMGLPSLLATWVTMLLSIGLIALLVFFMAPQIADELDDLGRDVRRGTEDVVAWLTQGPLDLQRAEIDRYIDRISEQLRASQSSLVSGALKGAYLFVELVAGLLLTLVLTFFFVKDGERISKAFVGLFPRERRDGVREVAGRAWQTLGAYIRGTAIVGLVDAAAIGLALVILGVPLVLPLVVITFFGAFFPLVGAVVAGTFAALVALVTEGFVAAAIVAAVTLVVQQVEGDVLQPIVLGRAVQLHPLVILLSLTAGAIVAGIAGAFLAVPVAAVLAVVVGYFRSKDAEPAVEVKT